MNIFNIPQSQIGYLLFALVERGLTFDAHYNPDKDTYTIKLTGGY